MSDRRTPHTSSGALTGASRALLVLACAALVAMMGVVVTDVVSRALLDWPIVGTVEIVELTMLCVVFCGLAETFRRGLHIAVDIIDHVFPARVVPALKILGTIAALGFLTVAVWQMAGAAWDSYSFGDRKPDTGTPVALFWAPALLGSAVAIAVLADLAWRQLRAAGRRPR